MKEIEEAAERIVQRRKEIAPPYGAASLNEAAQIARAYLSLARREREMREALENCAAKFEDYARQHRAKGTTEGEQKAATNDWMAKMCRSILSKDHQT